MLKHLKLQKKYGINSAIGFKLLMWWLRIFSWRNFIIWKWQKNEQVQTYFNRFCQVLDELTNARAKVSDNETTTTFLGPCQGHLQV
jgi:hypothetical protein